MEGFYGDTYAKQRSICTFITRNQPYLGVRIIYIWAVNYFCCLFDNKINSTKISRARSCVRCFNGEEITVLGTISVLVIRELTDSDVGPRPDTGYLPEPPQCKWRSFIRGCSILKWMCKKQDGRVLYFQVTVHRDNLRINNQQDAWSIQNFYFVTKLYMFRASSVPIMRRYQLYTWQLTHVQLITPDDGQRRCPKHGVSWQNKNFGYWMHLVGYLYDDGRVCAWFVRTWIWSTWRAFVNTVMKLRVPQNAGSFFASSATTSQELRSTESAETLLPTCGIRISKRHLTYVVLLSLPISASTHDTSRCATIITSLTPNKLCRSTTQNEHNANPSSYFRYCYSLFATDDAGGRELASKQYVNW